jgi:hypothetical protein
LGPAACVGLGYYCALPEAPTSSRNSIRQDLVQQPTSNLGGIAMDDWRAEPQVDEPPQRERNYWLEYAIEKVDAVLLAEELHFENRNGTFTWTWVAGLFFVGAGWWGALQPNANWTAALNIVGGIVVFIVGVALRINNGFELRRVRRLLRITSRGRLPE